MRRQVGIALVCVAGLVCVGPLCIAMAQDTPAAKATRKKLQQKITLEVKDLPLKEAMDEIKRELDGRLGVKIDNLSGISNNMKITYKAKDQTLESVLGGICDKYEFGYVVISKSNDRYDGWILLRKSKEKERGYEAGKEPKKEKS